MVPSPTVCQEWLCGPPGALGLVERAVHARVLGWGHALGGAGLPGDEQEISGCVLPRSKGLRKMGGRASSWDGGHMKDAVRQPELGIQILQAMVRS